MDEVFYERLLILTAEQSVGTSAVRNQGAKGVKKAAQNSLKKLVMRRYLQANVSQFTKLLDEDTETIRRSLPAKAKHWGTARKCINLFLRSILYNRYLCDRFDFLRFEGALEIPLDSYSVKGLRRTPEGGKLPKDFTIKRLRRPANEQYQAVAQAVAERRMTSRVHLDTYFFRQPDIVI